MHFFVCILYIPELKPSVEKLLQLIVIKLLKTALKNVKHYDILKKIPMACFCSICMKYEGIMKLRRLYSEITSCAFSENKQDFWKKQLVYFSFLSTEYFISTFKKDFN